MEVSHVKTATAALSDYCTSEDCTLDDEQQWRDLYTWLLPLVEMWVYYADVPSWQKRGSCVLRETYEREGFNPKTQETVMATRRRFIRCEELPRGEEFRTFCAQILGSS